MPDNVPRASTSGVRLFLHVNSTGDTVQRMVQCSPGDAARDFSGRHGFIFLKMAFFWNQKTDIIRKAAGRLLARPEGLQR